MSVNIDTIGIGVDTREVKNASRDLDSLGRSANKASKDVDNLSNTSKKSGSSLSSMAGFAKTAAIGIAGVSAALIGASFAMIRSIDEYTKYTAQLKLATRSQDEFKSAMKDVSRIANTAQASISTVGTLYARLSNAMRDLGASQADTARVTETVALALKVSGSSAGETSSAMLQLSQAFGSGVLRGEEFNAMMESAPNLMRALAESIGVPLGALRNMASEGLITGEVLTKAFGDPKLLEKLREQAKEVETAAGSIETLKNKWIELMDVVSPIVLPIVIKVVEGTKGALDFLNIALGAPQKGSVVDKAQGFFNPIGGKILNAFGIDTAAQKQENAARREAASKNNLFNGIDFSSGNIAPNFGAGVVVQDVDKIHKQQDALYQKQKDRYEEEKRKYEQAEKEKLALWQKNFDEKKAQDIKWFEDELELEEYYNKQNEKDKIDAQKKWFDLEEKRMKELHDERMKLEEDAKRVQERNAKELSQALTNGLFDSFKKGESFGTAMIRNLAALAKTWLARMFEGLIGNAVSGGSGGITSALSSIFGGGGSSSSGSSIFSSLSGLGDLFSQGNSAIVSSIESLGTFLSTGTGGLGDLLGGAIGQYSGTIANALPFASAAFSLLTGDVKGAIGSALGAALTFTPLGPVGGIIGSLLGSALGGIFGGSKLPPRYYSGSQSYFKDGEITSGNIASKYKNAGGGSALTQLNEQVINNVNALLKSFGLVGDLTQVGSVLNKKTNSSGGISAVIDGKVVAQNTGSIKKGSIQQAFDALAELALGSFSAEIVRKSNLSDGVKKFFDGLTKKDDVSAAIGTLASLNVALRDLPPVFDAIRNAIDTTVYKTSIADLSKNFSAIGTYTSLFYTEKEQFATYTKQLTSQFDALGAAVPKSRDEFRKMVDGIKVTDESTSNLFNGLVALAPAMDAFFKQIEALNGATKRSIDSFTSLAEYRAYVGVANNYGDNLASDFTANTRTGAISVNANGKASANGNLDVATLLLELRDLTKQMLRETADGTQALVTYGRVGIPTRAI
jgi:tape measure domain-containing protein